MALAVILTAFRLRGSIDLDEPLDERLIATSQSASSLGTLRSRNQSGDGDSPWGNQPGGEGA